MKKMKLESGNYVFFPQKPINITKGLELWEIHKIYGLSKQIPITKKDFERLRKQKSEVVFVKKEPYIFGVIKGQYALIKIERI